MPKVRRARVVSAPPEAVWDVVADPHHLPRWWPKVRRVEDVSGGRWTQVLMTAKGRPVRADFRLVESSAPARRVWAQELPGTPFERFLREAVTEVDLTPAGEETEVSVLLRQKLRGLGRF